MLLDEAIDVFTKGFARTRSFTHPYLTFRCGPLWVMRDAPRRSGTSRAVEVVASGIPIPEVIEALDEFGFRKAFLAWISTGENAEAEKEQIKRFGYRLLGHDPLFMHRLQDVTQGEVGGVRRVRTLEEANAVAKAARSRQILPKDLEGDDAPIRLYAAYKDEQPVGWVRSVHASPDGNWVSNLYVHQDHRRQGIASALMKTMLRDDVAHGVRASVLTASTSGTKLYPLLGYEQIGLLQLFAARA